MRLLHDFRCKLARWICPEVVSPMLPVTSLDVEEREPCLAAPARSDVERLISAAQTYAAHKRWSMNTVSLRAAGKGTYLADLLAGKVGITLARRDRILQWFADHWPEELEWPNDIPRPAKSKEAA